MAGASRTLDPIAAAEAGIAGSKDLIAAVARDLGQHQRWLAHYQVAERRHARRVMVQDFAWRLELARRRMMRRLKRFGVRTLRLARAILLFSVQTGVALFDALRRAAIAAIAWLRPRAYAVCLTLGRWLAASWSWTVAASRALALVAMRYTSLAGAWLGVQARHIADNVEKRLAAALDWTLREGHRLGRASFQAATSAALWFARQTRAGALALRRQFFAAWSWTRPRAQALARSAAAAASSGARWIAATSRMTARNAAAAASSGATWIAASSRDAARALQGSVSAGASRTFVGAQTLARVSHTTASAGLTWAALNARRSVRSARRLAKPNGAATPLPVATHRALVVRRSTALICIETKPAGLPALRPS